MKRLAIAMVGMLILVTLVAAGCAPPAGPPPGEEASTCVGCHSDKDLLKKVATPEPEEEKSEATSGEG